MKNLFFILAITIFSIGSACSAHAAQDIGRMLPTERSESVQGGVHLSGSGTAKDPAIIYVAPKPLHGNYKTMKFHNQYCDHYDCRTCTKIFKTRAAAEKAGYSACGKCGG